MQGAVGDGTSDQWEKANVVSEADAQPGDLVSRKDQKQEAITM